MLASNEPNGVSETCKALADHAALREGPGMLAQIDEHEKDRDGVLVCRPIDLGVDGEKEGLEEGVEIQVPSSRIRGIHVNQRLNSPSSLLLHLSEQDGDGRSRGAFFIIPGLAIAKHHQHALEGKILVLVRGGFLLGEVERDITRIIPGEYKLEFI